MARPDELEEEDDDEGGEVLPIVRDPRKEISPKLKNRIFKQIRHSVRKHGNFELACEVACLPFETLERWLVEDPHMQVAVLKDRGDFKEKIAIAAQDPEATPSMRKHSLDLLGRLDKDWAPRSRTTLATQLQDFLEESERVESPEVFARWIARLGKYV